MATYTVSDGAVLAQFEFILPPEADLTLKNTTVTHTESVLDESVFKPAVYEHQFTIIGVDFANRFLRAVLATPEPSLRFRFGIQAVPVARWLPWQNHLILSHALIAEGRDQSAGQTLRLMSCDQLHVMGRQSVAASHRGKISEIVARIAKSHGLEAVIEATSVSGVYIQSFLSDAQFIRQRLLPRATNDKGVSNYLFFVRDNVLHFHTPDYQGTLHTLDYHNSTGFEISASEHTQKLFGQGIAGVTLVTQDPYTGESREVSSNPARSLRYSDVLYPAAFVKNGQIKRTYHLGQNDPLEVEAMAQNEYDKTRSASHQVRISFSKFVDMRHGDMLQLVYNQMDGTPAPLSGLYHVVEVVQQIKDMAMTSTCVLQRGETTKLFSSLVTHKADSQEIHSELEAPGRLINPGELGASTLTKGGGDQTSAITLRTVTDAGKLPA